MSGSGSDAGEPEAVNGAKPSSARRRSWLALTPLIGFVLMALVFALALKTGDPSKLPSALIGKPAPPIPLPPMDGLRRGGVAVPGLTPADFGPGEVRIVNFFASWCAPCVQEHPLLMELQQRSGARMLGVNYKDPAPGGRRFLGRYGNPYAAVGVDASGRAAIEWGVYGMPETFVVDGQGNIVMKWVGPLTREVVEKRILPLVRSP